LKAAIRSEIDTGEENADALSMTELLTVLLTLLLGTDENR
jgi:hypothetical protein